VDLLRLPVIGTFLRWPHSRRVLQAITLVAAGAVVAHGLLGPQISPRNLATVVTSIYWRGLLVVSLLIAGNLFCTACPMMLVRDGGRRLVSPKFTWPRALRGKWLAIALLVLIFYAYELFDIWDRPAATAAIVIGYFVLALVVDLIFKGATFCKHLCPIGQFNFIGSTVAPTEIAARDLQTCRDCRTFDCIKGRRSRAEPLRVIRRGCELALFVPAKVGNLDCTLCLDCVHACPHDNVALTTRLPAGELSDRRRRSGIGMLSARSDIAALAIVFAFAALANAFAMTAPAHAFEQQVAATLHLSSAAAALSVLFGLAIVVLPALLLGAAASLTGRPDAGRADGYRATIVRFSLAMVPFGFGLWLAHYGFHLATGVLTILPVAQSAATDLLGRAIWGEPAWSSIGMRPGSVYPIQVGLTLLGASGAAAVAHAIASRDYSRRAMAAAAPWLVVIAVMTFAALWILGQPMDMRGLGRFS
jgi:polyferredoxin